MAITVKMNAIAIGGTINTAFSGQISVPADGIISVDSRDAPSLLAAGATYIVARTAFYTSTAVMTATVGRLVASASLANGALAIANQPDVMRQGRWIIQAGTSAITAGTVATTYVANDGSTTTDNQSLITAASGITTAFTSKGVAVINTVVVSGLVGGASPTIQLDTTSAISVPIDPNTKDILFLKETLDSANSTIGTTSTVTAGSITPNTIPNSTHTYGYLYTMNSLDV